MITIIAMLFIMTFAVGGVGVVEYVQFISCCPSYYKCGPVVQKVLYVTQLPVEQTLMRLRTLVESGKLVGAIKDGEVFIRLNGYVGFESAKHLGFLFFAYKVRINVHEDQEASRVVIELRPFIVSLILLPLYFFLGLSFAILDSSKLLVGAFCLGYVLIVRTAYVDSVVQRKEFFSIIREQLEAKHQVEEG